MNEGQSPLLGRLANNLVTKGEDLNNAIEPRMPLLFEALRYVSPNEVRVVILGQDPTPQEGKATGVAFHVFNPRSVPAVLNMFLEVAFEGFPVDLDKGDVTYWANQGVLLLNTAFTCPHKPPKEEKQNKIKYEGHFEIWEAFTASLISFIGGHQANPSVWLLWGKRAKGFSQFIDNKHHKIEGGHPSPMGTSIHGDTFFGGNYFNRANQFLRTNGILPIDWSLSSSGLNSLTLYPSNWQEWQKMLLKKKEEIQLVINSGKASVNEKNELENELHKINIQWSLLPLEQLKQHYINMVEKIRQIQSN
ncbi:uncharacterized protein LOC111329626 [Stylophora pistillata]|nr:uncharacterized protein LOC111329626 [Stylophora pistillata]